MLSPSVDLDFTVVRILPVHHPKAFLDLGPCRQIVDEVETLLKAWNHRNILAEHHCRESVIQTEYGGVYEFILQHLDIRWFPIADMMEFMRKEGVENVRSRTQAGIGTHVVKRDMCRVSWIICCLELITTAAASRLKRIALRCTASWMTAPRNCACDGVLLLGVTSGSTASR